MTSALRKAHRYIWYVWAVLLPVGWAAAIWVIPDELWQQPARPAQPEPLPVVTHTRQSGDLLVNLRQDSLRQRCQVEILITKPLTSPNTTLQVETPSPDSDGHGKRVQALGLLGTRGVRRFNLDTLSAGRLPLVLRFQDNIQNRTLREIVFQ